MNKEEAKELLNKCKNCKLKECIRLWIYIYRHTKDKKVCRKFRGNEWNMASIKWNVSWKN